MQSKLVSCGGQDLGTRAAISDPKEGAGCMHVGSSTDNRSRCGIKNQD